MFVNTDINYRSRFANLQNNMGNCNISFGSSHKNKNFTESGLNSDVFIANKNATNVQNYLKKPLSNENNVKVSIIVPVYNMSKYLKTALDSLKDQSLKEMEFICVDDGSKDNSLEILNEYAKKDKRFKVIAQEHNNTGYTRNNGIRAAKGEYIGFVDPDDWVDKESFETLYNQAKKQDCDVLIFNYKNLDENNKLIDEIKIKDNFAKNEFNINNGKCFSWRDIKPKEFYGLSYISCNRIYNREFVKNNNIQFTNCTIGEDKEFVIGSTLKAKKIGYCDKAFYNYISRKGSAVHSYSDERFRVFDTLDRIRLIVKDCGLEKEIANDFETYLVDSLHRQFSRIAPEKRESYKQMCKKTLKSEYGLSALKKFENYNKPETNNIWKQFISATTKGTGLIKNLIKKLITGHKF